MVSNVYLHFFDESRLGDDVVRCAMGSYGIVRRSTVWYRILQSGTDVNITCWYEVVWGCTKWYVVVRSCSVLFVVVRCYTGWCGVVRDGSVSYGMIRCSTGWYGVVRGSTVWYVGARDGTE